MNAKKPCGCGATAGLKLLFPCSGAADVGAIADQAARKLTRDGAGKMHCLAGIGGRVPGVMKAVQEAAGVVAIDGCPLQCAKATLDQAGITGYAHVCLTDLGMEKGKTPATPEAINTVADAVADRLA